MTKFIVNKRKDAWKTDVNMFFTKTNCPLSLVAASHKLSKFMRMSAYWQWKLAYERARISAVIVKLLLVLAFLRGFFSGFSCSPLSTNTNISKFQFDQDRGPAWEPAKADVASFLNTVILFDLLYFQKIVNNSFLLAVPWRVVQKASASSWHSSLLVLVSSCSWCPCC